MKTAEALDDYDLCLADDLHRLDEQEKHEAANDRQRHHVNVLFRRIVDCTSQTTSRGSRAPAHARTDSQFFQSAMKRFVSPGFEFPRLDAHTIRRPSGLNIGKPSNSS